MNRGGHVRGVATAGIVGLFGLVIAASMSDRVPHLARQYKRHIPLPDWMLSFNGVFGIHFLLWSTLAFGSVLLVAHWWVRLLAAGLLFIDSVLLELLQDRYTAIRRYQHIDLAANAVGIVLGVVGGAVVLQLVKFHAARVVRADRGADGIVGLVPVFAARTDDDASDAASDDDASDDDASDDDASGSLPQDGARR